MSDKPSLLGLLSEETVRRSDFNEDAEENPYWLAEETPPHPNPELGCIRRGLCCKSTPGRFAPGELEKAAEFMELSPDEFVKTYTVVDWIEHKGERVHVFAPAKLGVDGEPLAPTGQPVGRLYQLLRGPCIFFEENGCGIYSARPTECRRYICTNAPEDNPSSEALAELWLQAR